MKEKIIMNQKNALLSLFGCIAFAAFSLFVFYEKFVHYNPVIYMAGVVFVLLSFAGLTCIFLKSREKSHPVRKALIAGAAVGIVVFLGMTIIHSVILNNEYPNEVAGYMTLLLSVVFFVFTVITAAGFNTTKGKTALLAAVCVLLLLPVGFLSVKNMLPEHLEHPFEDKTVQTKGLDHVSQSNRLFVNADDSHWWGFWNELAREGKTDTDSLNEYVLQYADSGVTDLIFNIFCQSSDVPTEFLTFRGDLYGEELQNGKQVDYSNYYGLHTFYNEQNVDIFAVWIEKCKEVGINPWLSLRMNDCHDPDAETSQLRGELFYEAVENGWTIGEEYGYYRYCLNYKIPEIRAYMLDYTREQLLKYDVTGLELDFMREIYCFDYINEDNAEIVAIMNDYIRQTAQIVKEAEEKWGHDIKLSVRLMRDLDQCKAYGFDVLTWCDEKLVDSITVTPRFTSNDSAMPIADWIARCEGIDIYAGIETLINTQSKNCCASAEAVRGYGAQYLTEGADGLYLFNYMSAGTVNDRHREVYDTCGSLDEILGYSRRHIVTFQDTVPEGYEPYDPLPVKLKTGKTATISISTGYIPENASVTVYVGLKNELASENDLVLTLNGRACKAQGQSEVYGRSEADGTDVPQGYCREDCMIYAFTMEDTADLPNILDVECTNNGKTQKITYLEIAVGM